MFLPTKSVHNLLESLEFINILQIKFPFEKSILEAPTRLARAELFTLNTQKELSNNYNKALNRTYKGAKVIALL